MNRSKAGIYSVVVLILSILILGTTEQSFAAKDTPGIPVEVTGKLTVIYEDDLENNRARLIHKVKDLKSGKEYALKFKGKSPKNLRSGAIVKIHGKASGKELILALDETSGGSIQSIATSTPANVAGEQKILVIVADFLDQNATCSVADIDDRLFSDTSNQSVDDLYRETSHGTTWLSGQTVGPYLLDFDSSTCDIEAKADAAEAAARADGVDVDSYNRRVFVMPRGGCSASGYGTVGDSPSRAWVFVCEHPDVFAHEIGHNLGMGHAATPTMSYGDETDFMGGAQNKLRQINAPHKEQMGWLPSEQVELLSTSGIYQVAPLELDPTQAVAPQAYKIVKPGTGEYYYLSYRRAIGFDSNLSYFRHLDRLSVHSIDADYGSSSYLLSALADGESYQDAANNITVTQLSHNNDYTTIQVDFGSSPCITAAPSVVLSPSSQSAAAGTQLSYTVSVTNNDSFACGDSQFAIDGALPIGWSGSVSPASVNLSAGQNAVATLTATSPVGTFAGSYSINIDISDPFASGHSAAASASYTVVATCSPEAPIISLSPASQSGYAGDQFSYNVTVSNLDSDGCGTSTFSLASTLPSGWSGAQSSGSVSVNPGQSGQFQVNVNSSQNAAAGVYQINFALSNPNQALHAASKNASCSIQASSDTSSPSAPSGLTLASSRKKNNLDWNASVDNVGVVKYAVWRDGAVLAETTMTSYADSAISRNGSYSYYVVAYDAAGNVSAQSNTVSTGTTTTTDDTTTTKGKPGGGGGKKK